MAQNAGLASHQYLLEVQVCQQRQACAGQKARYLPPPMSGWYQAQGLYQPLTPRPLVESVQEYQLSYRGAYKMQST